VGIPSMVYSKNLILIQFSFITGVGHDEAREAHEVKVGH
jgi:hypothetical protein